MESYQIVLGANQEAQLPGGTFFIILSATAAVDVEFFRNRSSIGKVRGVEEPFKRKFEMPFDAVRITDTSGASNTVKVGIAPEGDADYNRAFGSVTVDDGLIEIIGGANNDAAPPSVNAIDVVASLENITAKYAALTPLKLTGYNRGLVTNTNAVLVTAAANTNGVHIPIWHVNVGATAGNATLELGGLVYLKTGGTNLSHTVRDLFVGDGLEVKIVSSSAGADGYCVYKAL